MRAGSRGGALEELGGAMVTLYHHPFCPHSRFVRLALGEMGIEPKLVEERAWERRRDFLLMAAEGATPVLVETTARPAGGRGDRRVPRRDPRARPRRPAALSTESPADRAEARRLTAWFNVKFFNEASHWIVREKIRTSAS